MNNEKKSVEQGVMDAIRRGKVTMRPRWHFVLSSALLVLGVIILALTLLYIMSFGIFELRQTGALFVPVFGMRGIFAFFQAVPWILIGLLLLFVVVLEVLVRRFSFVYRTSLLVSVLAILAIVIIGGVVVEQTRIHTQLFRAARSGNLPPPIGQMYRAGGAHVSGIFRGTIISTIQGGFLMLDEDGEGTTTVFVGPDTRLPLGADFGPGEAVVVFGDEGSGTVHAFGIREIDD